MAQAIRQIPWWPSPLSVVVGLGGFTVYAIWTALQGYGEFENYLSPFYSPKLPSPWRWLSPAFLVLWIPFGFRATCYYYRKAYYRSLFWDPPACARQELREEAYRGETAFPWIVNNIHRYFLYGAIVVLGFLWYDAVQTFIFDGRFGIRLGSLIFLSNVVLLSLYTFSCHSWRHLIGGNLDCYSCVAAGTARHKLWGWVSILNERHALWAWLSLFSVMAADVYVRLLIARFIPDVRFL